VVGPDEELVGCERGVNPVVVSEGRKRVEDDDDDGVEEKDKKKETRMTLFSSRASVVGVIRLEGYVVEWS
jgi:hypothetical protein